MKISQDKQFTSDTLKGANNKLYALANKTTQTDEDGNITYIAEAILINSIADAPQAIKQYSLDNILVTTASGKTFYADPISRGDMADAIDIATADGTTSTQWKLPSGVATVTLDELKEARKLALEAKGSIVLGV